jgi:hypothetical protein
MTARDWKEISDGEKKPEGQRLTPKPFKTVGRRKTGRGCNVYRKQGFAFTPFEKLIFLQICKLQKIARGGLTTYTAGSTANPSPPPAGNSRST